MAGTRLTKFVGMVGLAALLTLIVLPGDVQSAAPNPKGPTNLSDNRWAHFVQRPGGLSSNDVWSIVVADNAIWVGTDRGVSRYDGGWVNFAPSNEDGTAREWGDSVPQSRVRALTTGADGSILAGNDAGQLYRWDGESWVEIDNIGEIVTSLAEMDGIIYAGTNRGIHVLATETDEPNVALPERVIHSLDIIAGALYAGTDNGLWRLADGDWEHVSLGESTLSSVYAVSESGKNRLAVGTPEGVLILKEGKYTSESLPVYDELSRPALVQTLASDSSGRLWAGTDGAGVYEFSPDAYIETVHGQANDANVTIRYVRDIAVDTDGSIWFATPTGVYRYQVGMWTLDVQGDSVSDPLNHVNDLLVASDGALWIATGGGGIRVKPDIDQAETVYSVEDEVPSTVLALEEDTLGNIWAGTFYGLFQFNGDEWLWPEFNGELPDLIVTSLLQEGPRLWIGTESGLAQYDTRDETVSSVGEFESMSVEALAVDGLQRLWVGTRENGVWVRESTGDWTQHKTTVASDDAIPGNWIIGGGLAADWKAPGNIWALVLREGLTKWDGERWSEEDAGNQIPDNLLWTLMSETDPGRLWIGSEGGVTQHDGWTWGTLSQDDGLQSASAYAIARAQDGGYWIGGATGLTYYQPDQTPPWVRTEAQSADVRIAEDGAVLVPVGDDLTINFTAGDLQTLQEKLVVMKRVVSFEADGPWTSQTPGTIDLTFAEAGEYELQIVARDQSFNYSDVYRLPVRAFVPPPMINVPGLGAVDPNTFGALAVLGIISLLGAGYVLFEVLQQRRRSVEALNRGFNPYISGEPVRSPEMFFGRRDLVQRIVDTLHNNSVMIHGERRIGKTTLLYQLAALLRDVDDDEYWFVPIYVDLEGTPEQEFFHLLIEEIVHGVSRLPDAHTAILPELEDLQYRPVHSVSYDDRAFHRDLHRVINVLDEYSGRYHAGQQLRLILLLDEMDVMSRYDSIVQQQLRRIFMREFASRVGAVVAGIRISKDWDRVESPWYNMFNEIALEPFTDEDAQALLIEPVEGYYRFNDDALDFILEHSLGRPYRVQQYGLEAVNSMLANRRRKISIEDAMVAHERIVSTASQESAAPTRGSEYVDLTDIDETIGK